MNLKELARSVSGLSDKEKSDLQSFMRGAKTDQPDQGAPDTTHLASAEEAAQIGGLPSGDPIRLGGVMSGPVVPGTTARRFTGARHADWGETVSKAVFQGHGQKDLIAANAALPVFMPAVQPIELGIPLTTFRQLLPTGDAPGGQYRYLKQTVRTSNAAIVIPGATKPSSIFTLAWQDGRTSVVAHVNEPLDRFMFKDAPQLGSFVDGEMYNGVVQALEQALLTSGPDAANGKNWVGFLHATSGIQTQAFDTDALVSIRRAIQKVDNVGIQVRADGIVMHPNAWAELELMRDTQERFMLTSGPANSATMRLWSRPVALTDAIPEGIALVGNFDGSSALLSADNGEIEVSWSDVAMDVWVKNQVIWRAEGRWALALLRANGFCQVDLIGP